VRLQLQPHVEPIRENPLGELFRIQHAVDRREENGGDAADQGVLLRDIASSRSMFDQSLRADSPLPGHFTSMTRMTPGGTWPTLMWPPVSTNTVNRSSSNRCMSG
jgi:hypothetical protein